MHKCDPPVVHGDLSCDTIYIQHNGLIKIGSIAPDIVNTHVKTCIDLSKWSKHMHYIAPELKEFIGSPNDNQEIQANNPSVDIYAFGIVALEVSTNHNLIIVQIVNLDHLNSNIIILDWL